MSDSEKMIGCCIVMTEWDEFKKLGSREYKEHMRSPNIVDARRIYDPEQFKRLRLEGIGLGPVRKSKAPDFLAEIRFFWDVQRICIPYPEVEGQLIIVISDPCLTCLQ